MNYLMAVQIDFKAVPLAVFLFVGIVFLSLLPSGIIRSWVYMSAFQGLSAGGKKKRRNNRTIWQKVTLWYLVEYPNAKITKRRIFAYWTFWIIVFVAASIFALSALGIIPYLLSGLLLFPLLMFDIIIWIIWVLHGKKVL